MMEKLSKTKSISELSEIQKREIEKMRRILQGEKKRQKSG